MAAIGGEVAASTGSCDGAATRSPVAALDISAGAGRDLRLCFLLAPVPNQGLDRACRHSSGAGLFAIGRGGPSRATILVCSDASLAGIERSRVDAALLGGTPGGCAAGFECVAARDVDDLLCLLCVVRQRGAGFFRLSIGWNAPASGLRVVVSCARGIMARIGTGTSAIARKQDFAAVGVVQHLL